LWLFPPNSDNASMSTPAVPSPELMRAEKRSAAGTSVWAAVVITGLKIVVGITTGSLGILSEAAHSGLDLVAAILTFFSVRVSDKPADAEHQYGHGKVENFSAFVETGLLLLTCIWIIYEAVIRLFFRRVEIEPSIAAFAVMLFSMGVDWWRSRILGRIATKYDSQALEADALHFSTDIWSAGVVVFGLALVLAGRTYHIWWLRDSDPIAALIVAGVGSIGGAVIGAAGLVLLAFFGLSDVAPAFIALGALFIGYLPGGSIMGMLQKLADWLRTPKALLDHFATAQHEVALNGSHNGEAASANGDRPDLVLSEFGERVLEEAQQE